jgi:hypothetical protein
MPPGLQELISDLKTFYFALFLENLKLMINLINDQSYLQVIAKIVH